MPSAKAHSVSKLYGSVISKPLSVIFALWNYQTHQYNDLQQMCMHIYLVHGSSISVKQYLQAFVHDFNSFFLC